MPAGSGGAGSVFAALSKRQVATPPVTNTPTKPTTEQPPIVPPGAPQTPGGTPFIRYPRPIGGGRYVVRGNYTTQPIVQLSPRLEFETTARAFGGLGATGAVVAAVDQFPDQPTPVQPARPVLQPLPQVLFDIPSTRALSASDRNFVRTQQSSRAVGDAIAAADRVPDALLEAGGVKGGNTAAEALLGIKGLQRGVPATQIIDRVLFGNPAGGGEENEIALLDERNAALAALQQGFNLAQHVQFRQRGIALQLVIRDP